MKTMRSVVFALSVCIVTAAAVPAAAAGDPPSSAYRPAGRAATATPQVNSPSGCVETANDPHASAHEPGRMNGEVRATCNLTVPRMYLTAQLWETRWWGWDRIGSKGTFDKTWYWRGSAFGNDKCRNNNIRLTGYGFVDDRDGKRYYASTESKHIKNPCHL